ncbi:MAG: alpha/beta hydrolase, partial [Sandaracinaceae bacterium]|nr:alpha/beta hydrolase [Sandaracinaceae bacterium]
IFGFHPRGTSLVRWLAEAGREVWVANLRAQGRSRAEGRGAGSPSLRSYAEIDLTAAIDEVLASTLTRQERVDVLGCSLGGSIAFAHLALARAPKIGALVAVGSPLRWRNVPAVLRVPFSSPRLAGMLRVSGARSFARVALPLAMKVPSLLSMYANPANIDLEAAPKMTETVEDPHPRVNKDIAKWLGQGDMVLRGVNVTEAMRARREPLLLVVANKDGIVPEATALSPTEVWGGEVTTLRVGDVEQWYAHADLFVGHEAPQRVFEPITKWLRAR